MRRIIGFTALVAMILMSASCEQYKKVITAGSEVNFDVSIASSMATRTVYSGDKTEYKERIDWEDGDLVGIYSDTSVPHNADYKVSGTITPDGALSKAKIVPNTSDRIKWWGDEETSNTFYAVYPSPSVKSGDVLGNGTMKGNVPAVQTPISVNEEEPYIAKADMTNEYMVSKTTTKYTSNVSLDFIPMTTAIEFTIKNGYVSNDTLKITSVTVTSANHNLSGTFTANLADWAGTYTGTTNATYPVCTAPATDDGGKSVTIDFSDTVLETTGLMKDEALTFTVFLRPTSAADDLSFKITKADGSWLSTKLATSTGSYISFPQYKKSYVTGLLIPEGAQWTVKYDPTVQSWDQTGTNIKPTPETDGDPFVTSWDSGIDDELTITDPYNGHEYVEIGGVKWATCNVGANTPKEYGWYFFWGDTTGYVHDGSKWVTAQGGSELSNGFSLANTQYHTGSVYNNNWYKYIPSGKGTYWIAGGSPDDIDSLELDDDAARANWGGSWRMPTQTECQKLYEACVDSGSTVKPTSLPSANPPKGIYWVKADQKYISDYTGAEGILFCDGENMLFFVAAGYGQNTAYNGAGSEGRYWFSTLKLDLPHYAYRLGFRKDSDVSVENASGRSEGLTVRPVSD